MTPAGLDRDRAAAVREALRRLVATRGFHGASMSAVAKEAGVATGTAYVHYESKDELVHAAYLELKRALGEAGVAAAGDEDPDAPPYRRFERIWRGIHDYLAADPDRARFLIQVDASPYAAEAHRRAMAADGDPLLAEVASTEMLDVLVPLPPEVLYDVGIGPLLRLVASERTMSDDDLMLMAHAAWRAITPEP